MPVAETPAALGRPPSPSAADNENIPSINMPIPPETESQPMHNATSTMPPIDSVSHDQPTPNIISLEQLPLQTTSLPTTSSSQNFEVDDPSYLLQLINSGEIQVVATADKEGVATLPVDTVWNEHIDAIFSPSVNAPRTAVESKKKSRAITSHRLLTSVEKRHCAVCAGEKMSDTGYNAGMQLYAGRQGVAARSVHGVGYEVVMQLMEPYLYRNHHLVCDNYFTSQVLCSTLFDKDT
uniref:PiggyBac transposable element-derived protein domain-containing protein n=1 Tax=Magallana gigas TaxID=29159 RepID=A0A8W8K0Z7_MAGGI